MVALRRRRLGDIDGVGARKGLLQPLRQGVVQVTLFSVFLGFLGGFGNGNWPGHWMSSRLAWFRTARDLAREPTMLDDKPVKKYKKGRDVHEAHYLHRRSAPAAQAPRAEGVFRLCGSRLLYRGHAARQP